MVVILFEIEGVNQFIGIVLKIDINYRRFADVGLLQHFHLVVAIAPVTHELLFSRMDERSSCT